MIRWNRRGAYGVVVAAFVAAGACGGSVTPAPGSGGNGGPDGGGGNMDAQVGADAPNATDGPVAVDVVVGEANPPIEYDGTTGKVCTSDADCVGPGGPGIARCSSTVFAPEAYYATAVCILPTCAPVSDTTVHYCDGPDAPSSPGVCVPQDQGNGICLPKCTYDTTGSPAVGCQGKDVCFAYVPGTTGGVGYCWGGCTANSDCPTGQLCQTDQGLCMEGLVPPTKTYGTACTKADSDDGACNCLYGGTAETGYCSSFCVVGGADTCPTGSVCDGLEYRQDGFTASNPGMGGYCSVACPPRSESGPGCPANSSCTDVFAAGPDCVP